MSGVSAHQHVPLAVDGFLIAILLDSTTTFFGFLITQNIITNQST
jgi:hypothetical protein